MRKLYNTITQISVGSETENPVFGECIRVKLDDECGGMFIVLEQDGEDDRTHQVRICFDELVNINHAISTLVNQRLAK